MSDTGLTIKRAIEIQAEQLAEWKTKLLPHVYNALVEWAHQTNETETDPYKIRRGSDLNYYVLNYPKHV
jgi:hypothetical protein